MAEKQTKEKNQCTDFACPKHGKISLRGRSFKGKIISKHPKRIAIEFERTIHIKNMKDILKERQNCMRDCLIVCQRKSMLEIM